MRTYKGKSLLTFPTSFIVIDIETTGLDPAHDRIIEVAAIKIQDDIVTDTFSSLINPEIEIDSFISELTGITNDELAEAPLSSVVLNAFSSFIGDSILVGHNINFDINFLYDNFEKYLALPLQNNFVDTLRLSRYLCKNAPSHKLSSLADYLNISAENSHRALSDCYTTLHLYSAFQKMPNVEFSTTRSKAKRQPISPKDERELLKSLNFDDSNPFFNKRVAVKGTPQLYSFEFMKTVCDKCNARMSDVFYNFSDYVVFCNRTYTAYMNGSDNKNSERARRLSAAGSLTVLSEEEWCKMLDIPLPSVSQQHTTKRNYYESISAKNIHTENTSFDETHPLYGKTCVFTGTLEKMPRKDAMQMVVDFGGFVGNSVTKKTNYLILGNNDYCSSIKNGKSSKQKKAESLKLAGNDIEIISENVFYDMINESNE